MIPLYLQITNYVEDLILSGKYLPGDKIPSENELAEKFDTTRTTVRKALDDLEKKGLLTKIFGVGTFVTEINIVSQKKIGIIVHNSQIVYGIIKFCSTIGSKCFIAEHTPGLAQEKKAISELLSMGVDGIIMEPTVISLADDLLKELIKENFPVVFVDRSIDMGFPVPTVITDNSQGGRLLGEHMRKVHRIESAIFVTSEDLNISSVNERYEGIKTGLRFSPTIIKVPVIDGDYSNLITHLKKEHEQAIFFCNDMMAVRGYSFLLNKGFNLPKDVKIIGFDNDYVSKILEPKLTTVKQNLPQLGEYAASIMVRLIKKENVEDENRIPVSLIVRASCGCMENKEDIHNE